MLIRYSKGKSGKLQRSAEIYVKKEHGIDRALVDPDTVKIIQRLKKAGFVGYVVGGAVRDLLIGKRPKDFDIVTDAEPNQIRRLFRNSRIIGKRFRLVHIFFHDDKIIEVSTFRSIEAGTFNNVFGTMEEDVQRRDFSINALYYDPLEEQIVDFVKGFRDIKARRLRALIPLQTIFAEDPVRMIRAIKYSISTKCSMGFFLRRQLRRDIGKLGEVSDSRLSEEAFKILSGGWSEPILRTFFDNGLMEILMPQFATMLREQGEAFRAKVFRNLASLDDLVRNHGETRRGIHLSHLICDYLLSASKWATSPKIPFVEAYYDVKNLLKPVIPPNIEVERAVVHVIRARKHYAEKGVLPPLAHEQRTAHHLVNQAGKPMMSAVEAGFVDSPDALSTRGVRSRRRGGEAPKPAKAAPPSGVEGEVKVSKRSGAARRRRRREREQGEVQPEKP